MGASTGNAAYSNIKRARRSTHLFVILLLVIGTILALTGQNGSVAAEVDGTTLGVLGTYGEATFISLDGIESVELKETLNFGACLEGEETKNTVSGRYSNEEFGEYTLHVYTKSSPYVVVTYEGGKVLVFNQKTERLTKNLVEKLEEAGAL